MLLSEGQMSDYKGAALMLPPCPRPRSFSPTRATARFRAALAKRGIAVCIPSKSNRKVAIPYDALLYKQRHKMENMFRRLKDWRIWHKLSAAAQRF
jgi:transposase